jgi:cation transport ATPase
MAESAPEKDRASKAWEADVARLAVGLAVSALFTLPLLADTVAGWFGWRAFYLADAKIQLALATIVHLWGGAGHYRRALRTGPVWLAAAALTGVAYVWGAYAAFARPAAAGVAFKLSAIGLTLTILFKLMLTVRRERED